MQRRQAPTSTSPPTSVTTRRPTLARLADLGTGRPFLVDVAHFASEWAWLTAAAEHVADAAGVDTIVSTLNTDPWTAHYASPARATD
ncbi:hypothetical protein GCM10025876_03050 [Demequina litorisediminis]|uniref:Uncharacterized protein n=1 Tax=Demequina litorisediminis TaxID=1849022 RepID=A0ABQ6I9H2_9MICO|nr:hypothetical protein GCM10025876_03050 [Demequina litorisediminis]